jgi:hypothetical protein
MLISLSFNRNYFEMFCIANCLVFGVGFPYILKCMGLWCVLWIPWIFVLYIIMTKMESKSYEDDYLNDSLYMWRN